MRTPAVSLIICTYAMPAHLSRVLESVAQQSAWESMEVIVADDGSQGETAAVVAEFAHRTRKPVGYVTHEHIGFHLTRCRNEGARIAAAPYLLFLDGDCLLPVDHVEQYLRYRRKETVHFGYCVRLDRETSERIQLAQIVSGEFTRWAPREELSKLRSLHRKSLFYQWIGHATKPVLKGGNIGIWRSDFERLNGFDENFRAWGCEDDDLSHRVRAVGLRVASLLGVTRTYHLWHPPALSKPNDKWRQGSNVPYLQRPLRLANCLLGIHKRKLQDISIRLLGFPAGRSAVEQSLRGMFSQHYHSEPELEILYHPSLGRFQSPTALRVVIAEQVAPVPLALRRQANLVLPLENAAWELIAELDGLRYFEPYDQQAAA